MSKFITTKYGTRINVEGLTPEQIRRVRQVAEGKGAFGTKGAALAKELQKRNAKSEGGQQGGNDPASNPAINPTTSIDLPDLGLNDKTGVVDVDKAATAIGGAELKDADTTFKMNNPGSETDVLGNTKTVTRDPATGEVVVTETGGALTDAAKGFLGGAIGTAAEKGQLDLSGEIKTIEGATLDLQPERSSVDRSRLDLGTEVDAVRGVKLDLTGKPQILQTGDVRQDAQAVADANFEFLTRNLDRDKQRELEDTKQMLAERGIPIDYDNPNSMWRKAIGAIDEKYQGLTDQAQQQALMTRDRSLESLVGAQSTAADAFLKGAGMQFDAEKGVIETAADFKGRQSDSSLAADKTMADMKGMEFDAVTGKAKDVAALKGMESGQAISVLGAANSTLGTVNPNFTPYAGGNVDISSILAQALGLSSGSIQGANALKIDEKTKMAQINKPTGGGGGGGGFGITIGGVAP